MNKEQRIKIYEKQYKDLDSIYRHIVESNNKKWNEY